MQGAFQPMGRCLALIATITLAPLPGAAQITSPPKSVSGKHSHPSAIAASSSRVDVPELSKTVVTIFVARPTGHTGGSGVLLDDNGIIATAAHVIAQGVSAKVRLSTGEMMPVEGVLATDEKLDIALLRVAGFGMPKAVLGNSDSLTVGQRLIAIGAPLGLETTVSDGLLSSIRLENGQKLLQISVPVSHGSSGGPIFTEQGTVVGLVVGGFEGGGAQNLNFAVPINAVRGRLALARTAPLKSFTEVAAGLSSEPNHVDSSDAVVAGSSDGEVNQNLKLDFTVLRGVEGAGEYKDERGLKNISYTRYFVGRDAKGRTTVERVNTTRVRVKVAPFQTEDAFVEKSRTVLTLSTPGRTQEWFDIVPQVSGIQAYSATVTINARQFQVVDSHGRREGIAPLGVLTPSMLTAAVAALPDSLPAEVFISTIDVGTSETTTTRVSFGSPDTVYVTVARDGTGCGDRRRTKDVKLPVVWGTFSYGTRTEDILVLQSRPHIRVDGMECIQLTQPEIPS